MQSTVLLSFDFVVSLQQGKGNHTNHSVPPKETFPVCGCEYSSLYYLFISHQNYRFTFSNGSNIYLL